MATTGKAFNAVAIRATTRDRAKFFRYAPHGILRFTTPTDST
jgi:hypothetical protein